MLPVSVSVRIIAYKIRDERTPLANPEGGSSLLLSTPSTVKIIPTNLPGTTPGGRLYPGGAGMNLNASFFIACNRKSLEIRARVKEKILRLTVDLRGEPEILSSWDPRRS